MTLIELYGMYLNDIAIWRILIAMIVISLISIIVAGMIAEQCDSRLIVIIAAAMIFIAMLFTFRTQRYANIVNERNSDRIIGDENFRGWVASYYPDHIDLVKRKVEKDK